MFEKLINSIQDKYKKYQEESLTFKNLLDKTEIINDLENVPLINKNDITISYKNILENCPDLNENKALIIRGLLPVDEIFLTVMYSRECKTNREFFLVPTNKHFWIINLENYKIIEYEKIGNIEIIKNNIMGKILKINNVLFNVNGSNEKIEEFINIINNNSYREEIKVRCEEMFCGIIPSFSLINDLGTGISLDFENNIVFHTKEFNYRYTIKEISNYELLVDDNVIIEKRSNRRIRLTTNKNSCYEMKIRITTKDNSFSLPIIKKSAFNELYQSTSSVFINNKKFALKLINILDELDENVLNGI